VSVIDDDCPGTGKCHGCMCWCDRCGEVCGVCDSPTCEQHHCAGGCGTTRPHDTREDWKWTCDRCAAQGKADALQHQLEWAEDDALAFEAAGNRERADWWARRAAELQAKLRSA
jgi:hypothetical protein